MRIATKRLVEEVGKMKGTVYFGKNI